MRYIEAKQECRVFDPTAQKKWLKLKTAKIGVRLKVGRERIEVQVVPEVFRGQLGELKNAAGWGKSLRGLPIFTEKEIDTFVENTNKDVFGASATKIQKNFERRKQLVRENFVVLFRFMVKEDSASVFIKSSVGASLRQKDRWVSVSIDKSSSAIEFCCCQCEAGKGGTCSHAYAVLHLLANWSLEQLKEVPDPVPCTFTLCAWNVPQARGGTDTPKFSSLTFAKRRSSESAKGNRGGKNQCMEQELQTSDVGDVSTLLGSDDKDDIDSEAEKESRDISSNLYEARAACKQVFNKNEVETLLSKISMGKNSNVQHCLCFKKVHLMALS